MEIIKNWKKMKENMENLHLALKFQKFSRKNGVLILLKMVCCKLFIKRIMMKKSLKRTDYWNFCFYGLIAAEIK